MFNEYFVNNAIYALFYNSTDPLSFVSGLPSILDTTTINLGLGGDLHEHGFEDGSPCSFTIYANPHDAPPIIRFRNENVNPLSIESQLWISIHCAKEHATAENPNPLQWELFTI